MLKIKILTLYYRHKFYFFYSITKRYISLTLYKAKSNFGDFKILLYFGLISILSLEAFISNFFYIKVQSNGFESLLRIRMNYFQLLSHFLFFIMKIVLTLFMCKMQMHYMCAQKFKYKYKDKFWYWLFTYKLAFSLKVRPEYERPPPDPLRKYNTIF